MFKRALAALLSATLLAIMSFTTAFASQPAEEVDIASYDSNILTYLEANVWTYLYTVDVPSFSANSISVTNHFSNPGNITVQQFSDSGAALSGTSVGSLAPGEYGPTVVAPNIYDNQIELRVMTDVSGTYIIHLTEGDINKDLCGIYLLPDVWTNVVSFDIFSLFGGDLPVANSIFSPGAINVRIVVDNNPSITVENIHPGDAVNLPINGSLLSQNILLQAQATNTPGIYYINSRLQ